MQAKVIKLRNIEAQEVALKFRKKQEAVAAERDREAIENLPADPPRTLTNALSRPYLLPEVDAICFEFQI